jgi:hypothetical protein
MSVAAIFTRGLGLLSAGRRLGDSYHSFGRFRDRAAAEVNVHFGIEHAFESRLHQRVHQAIH